MPLVNDIVGWINARVCNIIPGVKAYGIAKSALKDGKQLPYTGDKYIGVDDVYEAQVYHKLITLSTSSVPNSGYGDNEFSIQNTYGMAMVIYYDENKAGQPDQLYAFIQSAITGALKAEDYKSIRVNVISAILNDGQVWASEYGQTPLKLMGSQRLIQVNYSIVAVFDKQCISLPNCKN